MPDTSDNANNSAATSTVRIEQGMNSVLRVGIMSPEIERIIIASIRGAARAILDATEDYARDSITERRRREMEHSRSC